MGVADKSIFRSADIQIYPMIKRGFDIIGSCVGLIIFGIPMIIIAIMIARQMGRPIFFRQRRLGRNEQPFDMLKFRSMSNDTDKDGNRLPDQHRLTKLGQFLRKTSLDELPQFFNVLKGEMSLIGPRAMPTDYLPILTRRERRRFAMRPGISGLAQVLDRNATSWYEKMAADIIYVQNYGLFMDIWIGLRTIIVLLSKSNTDPLATSKEKLFLKKMRDADIK